MAPRISSSSKLEVNARATSWNTRRWSIWRLSITSNDRLSFNRFPHRATYQIPEGFNSKKVFQQAICDRLDNPHINHQCEPYCVKASQIQVPRCDAEPPCASRSSEYTLAATHQFRLAPSGHTDHDRFAKTGTSVSFHPRSAAPGCSVRRKAATPER